jgi:hypothetical protein
MDDKWRALKDLNDAAYLALKHLKNHPHVDANALKQIAWASDKLVDNYKVEAN